MQLLDILKNSREVVQQIVSQKIIASNNNKVVYESEDVIRYYAKQSDLQKPEITILTILKNKLPKMKMLDIGVGAGRTSNHFAFLAKEYMGIDYSSQMINACLKKFPDTPQKITFLTADARTMKSFKDNTFDFVLFSFNGIDYMDHEDRLTTLSEIRRITRAGGYFCFSSHNLNFLLNKCSINLSKNPRVLTNGTLNLLQMRLLNKKEAWKIIRDSSSEPRHTMVNDGAHEFKLKTYYVAPVEQLKQLSDLGFLDTKMYGLIDGREKKNPSLTMDHWVYYLSRVP